MPEIIIHNMTIDDFTDYNEGGIGYLISNRKCSECLHAQNITGLLNCCLNCGAKMDERK